MKKLTNLVAFLAVCFALPLAARPELLGHWKILFLIAASAVLISTQPPISVAENREKAATDRRSIWAIIGASIVSTWAPVLDWAFLQPFLGDWAAKIEIIHFDETGSKTAFSALPNGLFSAWAALGAAMIVGGLGLRIWSIRTLGRAFTCTVQIVEKHQLVTSGPYRFVRHPSYAGAFLQFVGAGIFLNSWLGAAVAFGAMGWAYSKRIAAEEALLSKNFEKTWPIYAARTWRLMPRVW